MKEKYNFKVFENYKCDGQLKLVQNGDVIEIVEDTEQDKDNLKNCNSTCKNSVNYNEFY